jgi:hypothetical protein
MAIRAANVLNGFDPDCRAWLIANREDAAARQPAPTAAANDGGLNGTEVLLVASTPERRERRVNSRRARA